MTTFVSQLQAAWSVLLVPSNFIAVLAGTMAGALLAGMFRRIGQGGVAALVLALPVASALDPTAGLMLFGAFLAAALAVTARHDGDSFVPAHLRVFIATLAAGLALTFGSESAAALLQGLGFADRFWLLVCGAALAVLIVAHTRPDEWAGTVALLGAGLALQLGPVSVLDAEHSTPVPVLLGLLALGPALYAVTYPAAARQIEFDPSHVEHSATVLPAFLVGVPATLGAAIFALNLGENGLYLGPRLMTQRPRLVLGLIIALIVAGGIATLGRALAEQFFSKQRAPRLGDAYRTRASAVVITALALVALYQTGINTERLAVAALATAVGVAAAWRHIDIAPLVTGLVIGQLMQPPLQGALQAAKGNLFVALASGSALLLTLTLIVTVAAFGSPLIARRLTPPPPATP